MKDFSSLAYDVCRCYINDHREMIPVDDYKRILGWIRSRNLPQLCALGDMEVVYSDLQLCRIYRQVSAFFKKNAAFTDDTCEETAFTSFLDAEVQCAFTNCRLDYHYENMDRCTDPFLRDDIENAQRIITEVLGNIAPFTTDILSYLGITSGATSTRPRSSSQPHEKLRVREIVSTARAIPYVAEIYHGLGYGRLSFTEVSTNRVEMVPKNWKTFRTIACEPTGLMPFQLAFDKYVKRQLRSIGVDLRDQSKNQRYAKIGSTDGSYATIDLSMASDTLSYNTALLMLPREWFHYLDVFRSPKGEYRGRSLSLDYAKFSSMGNGATFTLESLIFAACVKSVTGNNDFCVYGDDLIVKTEHVDRLTTILNYLGFSINELKSFHAGPFRESCGSDWFNGENVTPIYLRGKSTGLPELHHMVNVLASIAIPEGELEGLLTKLIATENLQLVPFNGNSVSGVWIDIHTAYRVGIIDTHRNGKRWEPRYKALVAKSRTYRVIDSRTLALWHFRALTSNLEPNSTIDAFGYDNPRLDVSESMSECTLVPILSHKYTRKWVGLFVPAQATPCHLFRWSELIARA